MAADVANRDALLARIGPLTDRIRFYDDARAEALVERAEVFRLIRDAFPELPFREMADRAGISDAAVSQQVDKARARLAQAG